MKIDKRCGFYDIINPSYLEDVAYSLYIKEYKYHREVLKKKKFKHGQKSFVKDYLRIQIIYQKDFFSEAFYLIRHDKINKIMNR